MKHGESIPFLHLFRIRWLRVGMPRLGDEDLSLLRAVEFVELVPGDPIEDDGAAGHVDPHRKRLGRAEHADQALLAAERGASKSHPPKLPRQVEIVSTTNNRNRADASTP